MKRIKSACLLQTIHFQLKEDLDHTTAVQMVREELNHYKALLERNRTKYQITDEAEQPDGSIIIHIKKQTTTTVVKSTWGNGVFTFSYMKKNSQRALHSLAVSLQFCDRRTTILSKFPTSNLHHTCRAFSHVIVVSLW